MHRDADGCIFVVIVQAKLNTNGIKQVICAHDMYHVILPIPMSQVFKSMLALLMKLNLTYDIINNTLL